MKALYGHHYSSCILLDQALSVALKHALYRLRSGVCCITACAVFYRMAEIFAHLTGRDNAEVDTR